MAPRRDDPRVQSGTPPCFQGSMVENQRVQPETPPCRNSMTDPAQMAKSVNESL